jgi:hypothetical protein
LKSEKQLELVQNIRQLVSVSNNPLIDELLDCGVLPILIESLKCDDNHQMQLEASWALTNIASGNSQQTKRVVEAGAVPFLMKLVESPALDVAEQSVWALGNIVGDGPELRDITIQAGLVPLLLTFVKPDSNIPLSFLRNITWVLSNLVRHTFYHLSNQTASEILSAFLKLIFHRDMVILNDSVWGLCHLTDSGPRMIQLVINYGFVPILVSLLDHCNEKIQKGALRSIGNIATSTDDHTQTVLDCDALNFIQKFLSSPNENYRKEATWFLSNITAGSQRQIQMVYDYGLLPKIMYNLRFADLKTQKEAVWVICNITTGGNFDQIKGLLFEGAIEAMFSLLYYNDTQLIRVLLDAITNILSRLIMYRPFIIDLIEDCDGLRKIEQLQIHEDLTIQLAVYNLEVYFRSNNQDNQDSGCRGR